MDTNEHRTRTAPGITPPPRSAAPRSPAPRSAAPRSASPRSPEGRPRRRFGEALTAATVVWSAICAALGLWWLLDPEAYPFDARVPDSPAPLVALVPATAASVAFLVLGVAGTGLAVLLGRGGGRTPNRRATLLAGAASAVVLGVLVPDYQVLAVLGYLLALTGPLVLVGLLAAGARRRPRNLLPLAVIGLAVVAGVLAGEIGEPTLQMLRGIRDGFARVGSRPFLLALMLAGGVLFAALTLVAARRGALRPSTPGTRARLDRWGRVATWVAAACPVPYALIRMTWLTPWPQGMPGPEAIGNGVRVFGIMLGLAAVGGAVLTLGLISPWGEVFPAWLPRLRGRPVPVRAAVVPGTLVSAVLCGSAISLIMLSTQDGAGWIVAAIPAPLWGPALGLATYAYYRRRTPDPLL